MFIPISGINRGIWLWYVYVELRGLALLGQCKIVYLIFIVN